MCKNVDSILNYTTLYVKKSITIFYNKSFLPFFRIKILLSLFQVRPFNVLLGKR